MTTLKYVYSRAFLSKLLQVLWWELLITSFQVAEVSADLGPDGLCPLYTFLPFTYDGVTGCSDCLNIGFSHLASAVMAMDHFNARDASVVPALDLMIGDCPVQFDLNNSIFLNADPMSHQAAQTVVARQPKRPCAAVGPYDDNAAIEMSTLAVSMQFPLVVYRAFSLRVLTDYASPFSTQVYPDLITTSEQAFELLKRKGRTNYTAFLYALTETGTHWHESVSLVMDKLFMVHKTYSYDSPLSPGTGDWTRGMRPTLQRVKDSGYRTIVVAADDPNIEIPTIAYAAVELGLTNGDYLWIFIGNSSPSALDTRDPTVQQLLRGSLHMLPFEGIWGEDFPFVMAWRRQGADFVQRLRDLNPVKKPVDEDLTITDRGFSMTNKGGYVNPDDDFFQKVAPLFSSGFIYDAVIAAGLGACRAVQEGNTTAGAFTNAIRSSQFAGVSFGLSFGCPSDTNTCSFNGGRTPESVSWVVLAPFLKGNDTESHGLIEIVFAENGQQMVHPIEQMLYADGRTVPPDLLRDPPEQNYLSPGLQAFGLALMGVTWLTSVASTAWIYVRRKHRILKSSQPYFLYFICVGAALSVSSILTMSFDESDGWSEERLSRACMTTPWLFSTGFILMYGGLFGKLWRINQVLQATRRKIDLRQVAWPSLLLVTMALIVLSIWSAVDPLRWEREEIDTETGESIGSCQSDNLTAFLLPLILLMIIPSVLTGVMAWRTRDVDEAYSESRYIFIMILIQAEVMLFAVPMIAFLRDVSTDARYIGYSLILWTFPMSALAMIIGPKLLAYRKARQGGETRLRGSSQGLVHITGLDGQRRSSSVRRSGSSGTIRNSGSGKNTVSQMFRDSNSSYPEEGAIGSPRNSGSGKRGVSQTVRDSNASNPEDAPSTAKNSGSGENGVSQIVRDGISSDPEEGASGAPSPPRNSGSGGRDVSLIVRDSISSNPEEGAHNAPGSPSTASNTGSGRSGVSQFVRDSVSSPPEEGPHGATLAPALEQDI